MGEECALVERGGNVVEDEFWVLVDPETDIGNVYATGWSG